MALSKDKLKGTLEKFSSAENLSVMNRLYRSAVESVEIMTIACTDYPLVVVSVAVAVLAGISALWTTSTNSAVESC